MLRSRLVAWRSVAANPSISPMAIGKNVTSAITTTFGSSPNPNQMISSGAIATIGSVWDATSSGVSARRSHGTKSTATAIAQPDGERHREPDRRDLQRRHGVGPQRRPVRPALLHHPQRRGQHLRTHARHVHGDLPHHEPDQHEQQRGHPTRPTAAASRVSTRRVRISSTVTPPAR